MSQNDHAYSEKRDFIRMRLDVAVMVLHDGLEIRAKCLNLSSTGMQLEAASQLAIGDHVKVRIPSEHAELRGLDADAEVVRVTMQASGLQSVGLAILSMN